MGCSIVISAGEASGDLNGAHLVKELKELRGDLHFWGAGGKRMRDAGVEIVVDTVGGGTIGILETLKSLPQIAAKYYVLRRELLKNRPDLFVPIDYGAFNIRLAQIAHSKGIPVVYYFPPSSWRKKLKNASKLLACGGRVITPFPWSAQLLNSNGIDARFVGHPLLDIVKPTCSKSEFIKSLSLSDSMPTIGLLPGSRSHEINEHIMPMVGCAEIINRELGGAQFIIGAAGKSEQMRAKIKLMGEGRDGFPVIRVVENRTYDCMAHSDLLITASGTATLEAAILGTPMVIIYRGSSIMRFEFLFRKAILERHIGLPNIVADRGICPELICKDVTAEKLADISLGLLKNENRLAKMRSELGEVRMLLGDNGAIKRAAETLLEMGGLK